ncbi:macro domain-containing protein [Nocardia salmonicida]|uniref:macro domain-containing protein n=1 Tax=Nocardia salmonicida TaxID=53431 RepID=UPI0007A4B7D0|nr:macro domain-containing protein [Nocardia salmonicida]
MIREQSGDLLNADVEALVNAVNTVGVMGKGIALQFKQTYPEMFREYARAARAGEVQIGAMHMWATGATSGPRFIINFPTKRHWRSPSRLADVAAGLPSLAETIERNEIPVTGHPGARLRAWWPRLGGRGAADPSDAGAVVWPEIQASRTGWYLFRPLGLLR